MFENVKERVDLDTFIAIISQIPSCIFFKDTELRYVFASHYWEQLNNADEDFDIFGKTDLEIRKDKENAIKAQEADRHLIETGGDITYTIKSDIDGKVQYLELKKNTVKNEKGEVIGIVGLINDVTEMVLLQEKLKYLSSYDGLTGVRNRMSGTEMIDDMIRHSKENKYFCIMDVDDFKSFNDTYSHQTGDRVLQEIAKASSNALSGSDVFFRIGGDEFAFLIDNSTSKEAVEVVINRIFDNISKIYIPEIGPDTKLHISVGITRAHKRDSFDKLYASADDAMYEAKQIKGNSYCWY